MDDTPRTGPGTEAGAGEGSAAESDRRQVAGGSITTRQLGGYVLIAALILAIVRFVRGSRARRG